MCTGKGACRDPICFVSNIQEVVAGQAVNTSVTGTEKECTIVSYGKCVILIVTVEIAMETTLVANAEREKIKYRI